jgi:peptide/nickel transport system substrate-binding protein
VGPDCFGYDPDLQGYPYDPEKAKALLAEAGYPDGFSIKYEFASGTYFKGREVAEAIASYWSDIGVETDLEPLEFSIWDEKLITAKLGPVTHIGWNYMSVMDADQVLQHYVSDSFLKLWSNPEYDALYAQQASTVDQEERLELLQEMGALLREGCVNIPLFQVPTIYASDPDLKGYVFTANGRLRLEEAYFEG